ncbi:hypothetical protein ALC57_05870 [Trachymyrmex cornetzi]|uniref:Uncharacterized protein n=1 Tax=Trachymyrmex cornetzi TaxID=471704 RepID=A0A151J9R3_9HYME|nr:hypothetical protein ALC57_05870 [Trachymyrmex cornetzi]
MAKILGSLPEKFNALVTAHKLKVEQDTTKSSRKEDRAFEERDRVLLLPQIRSLHQGLPEEKERRRSRHPKQGEAEEQRIEY